VVATGGGGAPWEVEALAGLTVTDFDDHFTSAHVTAMGHARAGELEKALPFFTINTLAKPKDPSAWGNLGLCAKDLGTELVKKGGNANVARGRALLCESHWAYWINAALGADAVAAGAQGTQHALDQYFGGKAECEDGWWKSRGLPAWSLHGRQKYEEAARLACADEAAATVTPSEGEKTRGVLSAATLARVHVTVHVCGVLAVKGGMDVELVRRVARANTEDFERDQQLLEKEMKRKHHDGWEGAGAASRRWVHRGLMGRLAKGGVREGAVHTAVSGPV
jgi:hypothetical protein